MADSTEKDAQPQVTKRTGKQHDEDQAGDQHEVEPQAVQNEAEAHRDQPHGDDPHEDDPHEDDPHEDDPHEDDPLGQSGANPVVSAADTGDAQAPAAPDQDLDDASSAWAPPPELSASDPLSQIVAALDAGEGDEDFTRSSAELKAIVEALIFASPDPLTPKALLKLLDNEPKEDVLAAVEELKRDYERPGGLQLVEVAGGYQIVTRPDLHEWVRRLFHERSTQKLSVQALETLAVIAYRQPITAIEITEIRGVNTSGVLNTLLERHLVKIVGRKQVVGRPFMYATTKEFLIRFGLKDLGDLPKVEEMAESLGIESSLLVEQTPPEEQLPLTEPDADTTNSESDLDGEEDPGDKPEPSVH